MPDIHHTDPRASRFAIGAAALALALAGCAAPASPSPSPGPVSASAEGVRPAATTDVPAAVRLNERGPQNESIAARVGLWDVTETVWDHPGAAPVTTTGLVAERVMMGSLLQEFIRSPADAAHANVTRTDLLTFNRVQGQWDYVSFDTRAPDGLMPAWSSATGDGAAIQLTFAPFAIPGPGVEVSGQLLRMQQTITFQSSDRDVKDQYFTPADGTGTTWLAHRYDYQRRA